MSESGMGDNPFGGLPFFGDMMKAMSGQGPLNWDIARQFALTGVGSDTASVNVDPAARIAIEQLSPIAQMHVADVLGLDPGSFSASIALESVTPAQWCHFTLDAYKPLFNDLAQALSDVANNKSANGGADSELESLDPMMAMMRNLSGVMAPAMLGMAVGSMVGQLAGKAFGQYDLLLPREPQTRVLVVPSNIDAFASDWSLPTQDMRMWVLVREFVSHGVLCVPHIREALLHAVERHVKAFRPDPGAAFERMNDLEMDPGNPMGALQEAFSNPEVLLGAVISPEQEAMMPALDALLATLVGLIDWAVDAVAQRLLGGATPIAEAVRRRRIEASTADRFVEHLLGIHYTRALVSRGRAFVEGVVERSTPEKLLVLLQQPDALPTPAEVDAPGLWLARLGLD